MRRPTLKRIIAPNASTAGLRYGTFRVSLATPIRNGINEGLVILLGRALGDQSRLTPRLRKEIRRLGIRYPNLDKLHPTLAHPLAVRSDPLAGRLCPYPGGSCACGATRQHETSERARSCARLPLGATVCASAWTRASFCSSGALHVTEGYSNLCSARCVDQASR